MSLCVYELIRLRTMDSSFTVKRVNPLTRKPVNLFWQQAAALQGAFGAEG